MQRSCSLLARREKKLEEKLLRENQLKTISVEAARDRDQLKALLERSAQELQDERELSRRKDEEIAILRRRLSATEEEARFLKEKLCRKDTELQHHRAQLLDQHNFLQRKCRECAQLRNQLDWINYKRDCQTWENENVLRAQEARLRNAGSPMSAGHNGMDRRRRPNFGPQNLRPRTWPEEQFYRREAAQTQRSAKPSFEQTLSPITEDGEEAKSARRNDAESNGKSAVLRDTTDAPDVVTSHLGNRQINQRQQFCLATLASPESNSLSAVSREPQRDGTNCGFEEYRTSQAEAQSKQSPSLDAQHPGTTQSLRLESKRETPVINGVSVNAGSISVPNYCKTSEGADCNKKTASLKEALENKRVIEMKMNEVSRAFVPSPSPTPSSVFSGGEDSQSEANTCNLSDSSCANSKQERRSKARKISKRKLSKHIRFRGHKIDVTDFTMQDFRELMWSACAEDGSADELLDFLASSAGRLEADARWQGKHSLGSPEDWLNLKGCYWRVELFIVCDVMPTGGVNVRTDQQWLHIQGGVSWTRCRYWR